MTRHHVGPTMGWDLNTIPPHYQCFTKVFSEQEAQHFPPSQPWDHMIELKDGAPKAIDCKIYPVLPKEDISLQEWLKEQQAKGYIHPPKSPYTSSFFLKKGWKTVPSAGLSPIK